ncbi:MAG TPA: hypothetical protein VGZ48_08725 [Candidatus Acidoferrales bacterium]|jgi:hypothetical protein|nr:hypothetical protein [Candidatus Acidoferrales bacterium]
MQLRDIVEKYRLLEWDLGKPVELSKFGLSREETERVFSIFDEDYHISRFFHFTNAANAAGAGVGSAPGAAGSSKRSTVATSFSINGFPYTHVSIDATISEIL